MFYHLEYEHGDLEVLCYQSENLIPLSDVLITSQITGIMLSERVAKILREIHPWSSTKFSTTILQPDKHCQHLIFVVRVFTAGLCSPSMVVSISWPSFSLLAQLGDSSLLSSSWLLPSQWLQTSYHFCLPLPPHNNLPGFVVFIIFGSLITLYQLYSRGTSCSIPGNTNKTHGDLLSMFLSPEKVFPKTCQWALSSMQFTILTHCSQKVQFQQNHLLPCFLQWLWVYGSDNVVNCNLSN